MKSKHAFTLIELLVVISIIAILASIAVPVFKTALMNAHIARATANARGIGLALRMFANDNDGIFPRDENLLGEEIVTSNDAFRDLVPAYVDDETVFAVAQSHVGRRADNKIEPEPEILRAGENHFAYVEGLDSSSRSNWPLLVDATDGGGHYTTRDGEPGSTWNGTKAIVITVSNSAEAVRLRGPSESRYIPRFDDPDLDLLAVEEYMGESVRLLEPAAE